VYETPVPQIASPRQHRADALFSSISCRSELDWSFRQNAGYQPGFGHTDNPADLSIEYRVSHAKALIDALKLEVNLPGRFAKISVDLLTLQ
jgi:hypothetical protein